MWLGQVKFFCTACGKEMTESVRKLIERRCRELAVEPAELSEKARDTAKWEMLRELGEEPANPEEPAFIKATALLLLELAYSPVLLCGECRSPGSGGDLSERVKLRVIKGGKTEE